MRGLLRWLRRLALTALALAVLGIAAALITAHTAWGREQLRRRIEAALQGAFPGGAQLAALDGSVLGTLTLRGVELDDMDHRPLVTAAVLHARLALWPLVVRTARLDQLIGDDVRVIVRDRPAAPPAPRAVSEPSPWQVELPDVVLHHATVEIERGRIALGELEVAGAVTVADGRVAMSGAVRGRWSRAGGAVAALTANGSAVLDGDAWIPGALVTLDRAVITVGALVLDPDHPRGRVTVRAPAATIAALVPELDGAVPGDVEATAEATIELAADGAETRVTVSAIAGDARLWLAIGGEPGLGTAHGVVAAAAIDLERVTRGRLRGRGSAFAVLDLGADHARGGLVAAGELDLPGLPVRRAIAAMAGDLDRATAVVLAGGDDGLDLAAAARLHHQAGAIVLDDARAAVSARGMTLRDAEAGAPRCRRITGELAVSARVAGTLAPRPELTVTGVAEGTRVTVEPETAAADCVALARPAAALAPGARQVRDATRLSIAALRSPFVVVVNVALGGAPQSPSSARTASGRSANTPAPSPSSPSAASGGPATTPARSPSSPGVAAGGGAALGVSVAGEVAATGVTYDDVTVAAASGSFALGVTPELQLDAVHVAATAVHRAGRPLGDARIDVARTRTGFAVAATARPAADGLAITTAASVSPTRTGYTAALGTSRVTLPDGTAWTGTGGSVIVSDPAAPGRSLAVRGVSLRRGDAVVALAADFAGRTGNLAARVDAEHVDVASFHRRARGTVRGTVDLARRGGQWQLDGAVTVAGLAASPEATPVDAAAHVAVAHGQAALEVHATGPALGGGVDVVLAAAAPRDPLDLAAWRALDRGAIRTAAITARRVPLSGLAGLAALEARPPAGTIDGEIDLAPGALRGALAVRGVELPAGTIGGTIVGTGTIEGDIALAPRDGDLTAHAAARLAGIAAADLTARLAVPARPFDPATWQRRGRDLVREVTATLADVAFDPALLDRLGIARRLADRGVAPVYRGRAGARLTLGEAAAEARLAIDLADVTGGALVEPVSQHLAVEAGPSGTHVRAELSASERSLGVLEGDVPITVDQWIDEPAAVLTAPITAGWTLPATPAAPILAVVGRRELVAGTIEGSATIRGTVAAPIVPALRIVARDLAVAPRLGGRPAPVITALEVSGTWDGTSATASLHGRERSEGDAAGGELHVVASGRPDALAAATATARVIRFDIAPIAVFLPGALGSAAGLFDGELGRDPAGRVTGELKVSAGALPLAAAIGTLHDASARITSDGRTITAEVHGQLGRGTIDLDATAPSDLATATARLKLRDVSPIAALRPIISADLDARFHREADHVRGTVTVKDGGSIVLPEHGGTPLLDATVPSDLVIAGTAAPAPRGPRAPAHPWLVADVALGDTQIIAPQLAEGLGVRGTLRSDHLEISVGDSIGVRGRIDIASADVDLLGRRYVVEPSDLLFDGTTDARLGIHMSYRFPEMTLGVAVLGRVSRPEPQFSSDAGGYTNEQLFGFFLGGEPNTEAGSQTRDQASQAVAGAGTRLISGKLGRQLTKVLPVKVDALSCEPAAAATTTASGSCTVGKWLSRRLFLAYRQRLQPRVDENNGDVQLQLRLGDRLLLEGTGGDRGYYGADLLWRHRW